MIQCLLIVNRSFQLTTTLFFLFLNSAVLAQDVVSIDYLLQLPQQEIAAYNLNNLPKSTVKIPFNFAEGESTALKQLDSLLNTSKPIIQIDFVYTRYHEAKDFDQVALNRQRLEEFRAAEPAIFDNNVIEWNFYEQVNQRDLVYNKSLFHGLVIHFLTESYYDGNDGDLSTEEEIAFVEEYLRDIRLGTTKMEVKGIGDDSYYFKPILKKKRAAGIRYDRRFLFWRKTERIPWRYNLDGSASSRIFQRSY
jgi:hypothetical protein